jgi:hypothetical protein
LVARFSAEESGKELGWECGLGVRVDLGKGLWLLLSKEPDKELSSLLAK